MPRKLYIPWAAEEAVEKVSVEVIERELAAALRSSSDPTLQRALASPPWTEALLQILADHRTWRSQGRCGGAISNRQLDLIEKLAGDLSCSPQDAGKRLQLAARLQTLSSDAEFALRLALAAAKIDTSRFGDVETNWVDPEILARAARTAVRAPRGRAVDATLRLTIERLVGFYTDLTGEPLTHTPHAARAYDGVPRSPCGRFVLVVMTAVEPGLPPQSVSTVLADMTRARPVRPSAPGPRRREKGPD